MPAPTPTIVSLLPSATEIVAALGLIDHLVGRSHECDYPPSVQALPVCTQARLNAHKPSRDIDADVRSLLQQALSIYQIDLEQLKRLQPTHIVTQDQCEVCAVSVSEVQQALSQILTGQPQIISLQATTLTEVWSDIERVASALHADAKPLLTQLNARLNTCQQLTQTLNQSNRPTVAALEWTDPPMAAGNWIPELIAIAGGNCLFGQPGARSPYLDWETLVAADPDIIVVMPCGFDLARTRQEAQTLTQRPGWSQLQAVKGDRVYLTDGNAYFNRPGPRLVDSVELLAEIFHPDRFHYSYQDIAWEKFAPVVNA